MQIPEYAITNQTLKNVAGIEYAKAIIESTTILQNWQNQLYVEATARKISSTLQSIGVNSNVEQVKKYLNKMPTRPTAEEKAYTKVLQDIEETATTELDDQDISKHVNTFYGKKVNFRTIDADNTVTPEEILAYITQLTDWVNGFDSLQTHPVIRTAIFRAEYERIRPYTKNELATSIATSLILRVSNYTIKNYYCLEEHFLQTRREYELLLKDAVKNDDYTRWIEYFSDIFNREITTIAENVRILAKDTKVAKAAGRAKLSQRQERIVTYLQDYGMLQNKDFEALFPNISEDTVLRELKKLMDKGIIVKRGKTKSSRYELP